MITLTPDELTRILVIEMSGTISEADIDNAIDGFQSRYPEVGVHVRGGRHGGFAVLVDWQGLQGWEKGAKTLGTITTRTMGDAVRRIAVVADDRFADELPRIEDVARHAEVRMFPAGQREAALAWLRSH